MSRDIWVSSDLHYNHANILNFLDYNGNKVRDFDSVEEMNQCILEKHNEKVKPGDIWYNLGDVFFGDKEIFKKDWPKFNGKKRLIVGNHDDIKFLSMGGFFQKVQLWRQFPEYELIMSHIPMDISSLYRGKDLSAPMLHVHGHIHTNPSPSEMHYCVCMEQTNYEPIHIEDLAVIARDRREKRKEHNLV